MSSHPAPELDLASIALATFAIVGVPTAWNIVARNEHHHHTIERAVGGKRRGVYLLAAAIFIASLLRDFAFQSAIRANPKVGLPLIAPFCTNHTFLGPLIFFLIKLLGMGVLLFGNLLVLTAFARLGITGTYLGDYFGILMPKRVTGFPFSCFTSPMYLGATLNFLGTALLQKSGVGIWLTALVAVVYYVVSVYFENPFTAMIYAQRGRK